MGEQRGTVPVRPGGTFWVDGEMWEVERLVDGDAVLIHDGHVQRVRLAALIDAVAVDAPLEDEEQEDGPSSIRTSSADPNALRAAEARLDVVSAALARPEPLLGQRVRAQAELSKRSERTLWRWVTAYQKDGLAGLLDDRQLTGSTRRLDPRWVQACDEVLAEYTYRSTPTRSIVLHQITNLLETRFGPGEVPIPSKTQGYEHLKRRSKGRHSFGSAKARRSVAERPMRAYGRLRPSKPGEYVVLDTTPLDVFAMEPGTHRWMPVELTVAMDLFSRCILGMRLVPGATRASDVANVLYQCLVPEESDSGSAWPYHGVPSHILIGTETLDDAALMRIGGLPAVVPETIVVDNGKPYVSEHVLGACARLGISVQPAIPHKPTDKPTVERFFRTLREGLLQGLPAYKGPDIRSRGKDVEEQSFYYAPELEKIIRQWIGEIYHHARHRGIALPELPEEGLSPAEMFAIGATKGGGIFLPARKDLVYDFLPVHWREIQHYGVDVDTRRYNGSALNGYRNRRSPYSGRRAGQWPIHVDERDIRYAYFRDPETRQWHRLEWEHAAALDQPFSQDAFDYAKELSLTENRHVNAIEATDRLLTGWNEGVKLSRKERASARRIDAADAESRAARLGTDPAAALTAALQAELPQDVVDLDQHRIARHSKGLDVSEDADVFEQYYRDRPDDDGLELWKR